jgi:hypothetical protein
MAQDLKLAKEIIEPEKPKLRVGQFWRDMVNGDVLRIIEFSEYTPAFDRQFEANQRSVIIEDPPRPILYAHCACYPRGEYYMGIQEMKASHFVASERFKPVGRFKSLWYKLKFKGSKPLA